MKISRMNRGTWGKVRAFFDLDTSEGFTIKGFKIIEGINGLFVSMPSQKGTNAQGDDEWYDTIFAGADIRNELNDLAVDYYKNQNDIPESFDANPISQEDTSSPVPEKQQEETNIEKDFDDLPF